jgi:hypothetical protein
VLKWGVWGKGVSQGERIRERGANADRRTRGGVPLCEVWGKREGEEGSEGRKCIRKGHTPFPLLSGEGAGRKVPVGGRCCPCRSSRSNHSPFPLLVIMSPLNVLPLQLTFIHPWHTPSKNLHREIPLECKPKGKNTGVVFSPRHLPLLGVFSSQLAITCWFSCRMA